jgi:hypothetical protein
LCDDGLVAAMRVHCFRKSSCWGAIAGSRSWRVRCYRGRHWWWGDPRGDRARTSYLMPTDSLTSILSDALHLVFFFTSWMILEWTADELMQLMLIVLARLKLSDALTSSYAVLHVHGTKKETECRMLLTYTSTHVNLDCISFK